MSKVLYLYKVDSFEDLDDLEAALNKLSLDGFEPHKIIDGLDEEEDVPLYVLIARREASKREIEDHLSESGKDDGEDEDEDE